MKNLLIGVSLAASLSPGLAHASSVYSGCAAPVSKAGHHTFFVDPVKGSKSGDGSASKPWRTLADVLDRSSSLVATQGHNQRTWSNGDKSLVAVNPRGPIGPGDVLMLMSGDHGSLIIQNNYNPDFITVMAAPGQKPVVDRLSLVSSGKWLFQGITFQSEAPAGNKAVNGLVNVGSGDWLGSTSDVIFDSNTFAASNDTSSWSASEWMSRPYNYSLFIAPTASCVAATNNHFYNIMNGIQLAGSNLLAKGNLIEKMSNDGIDMMASNVLISGNTIRDGVNNAATSPLHADGIQGWSLTVNGQPVVNKNVVVDSNVMTKTGDATLSYMQGISIFDGKWDGLTISNNIVVSNDYQGIALYGGTNVKIVNNTVIASDASHGTWIMATKGKGGINASNVLVRNNISPVLQITSSGVTADHNIVASNMVIMSNGGALSTIRSGVSGSNKIAPSIMSQFVKLNNATKTYDLRPLSASPALAFGSTDQAPSVDIAGKRRLPSVTAGAYN